MAATDQSFRGVVERLETLVGRARRAGVVVHLTA